MTSKILANGILRAVGILVLIGLTLFVLYKISTVLVYLIVSVILILIASPLVNFLKTKLKFKNTAAVVATLSIFILLIAGFVLLFTPLIIDQVDKLSLLDINSLKNNYTLVSNQLSDYLAQYNISYTNIFNSSTLLNGIDFKIIPSVINGLINVLGNFSIGFVSVLFITFFILKEKELYFESFKVLLPASKKEKIIISIKKSRALLSRYFLGLMLQLFIVFILYLTVLLIFSVDNAFIIALLCAMLNIIPYLGPLIGILFAALLTMISNINTDFSTEIISTTIYVIIGFVLVQLIDNLVSQPVIFSKSTNSHPLEIFLIIIIIGSLFGISGMIVAVPVYTVLKVIAKEFIPNNMWVKLLTKKT
ncbi:AI-2E family transporter [uncultured Flavobacterium sp.]|uniref:AI-2E family transporter n=1 Tax=uncultured Flavobacterium sp. TaxID=165435 RepID=UPI0030CA1822